MSWHVLTHFSRWHCIHIGSGLYHKKQRIQNGLFWDLAWMFEIGAWCGIPRIFPETLWLSRRKLITDLVSWSGTDWQSFAILQIFLACTTKYSEPRVASAKGIRIRKTQKHTTACSAPVFTGFVGAHIHNKQLQLHVLQAQFVLSSSSSKDAVAYPQIPAIW